MTMEGNKTKILHISKTVPAYLLGTYTVAKTDDDQLSQLAAEAGADKWDRRGRSRQWARLISHLDSRVTDQSRPGCRRVGLQSYS